MLFAISGSGVIRLRAHANGDISLVGIGRAALTTLLDNVCIQRQGHRRLRDWVICSSHATALLSDLEKIALRIR